MSFTYKYPRPALTVDAVIFRNHCDKTEVLLIQRGRYPYEGMWALPGGFVEMDETLEEAIARELEEETELTGVDMKQLHAFSETGRDPRGRTVSVAFYGVTDKNNSKVKGGDDARDANWFPIDNLPKLAFDHNEIVMMALKKV
jgi:8-oxo-dGTP diphosphatase